MKDEKDMKDSEVTESEQPDGKTTRNKLYEAMEAQGVMANMFEGMTPEDQEEWKDFTAKSIEHYDRLIRMIEEVSSTPSGKKSLHDEINRRIGEE
jgi:hypothetical protein